MSGCPLRPTPVRKTNVFGTVGYVGRSRLLELTTPLRESANARSQPHGCITPYPRKSLGRVRSSSDGDLSFPILTGRKSQSGQPTRLAKIDESMSRHDQNSYFIGWDVGAWNCDDNSRSRDALAVLVDTGNEHLEWAGGCAGVNVRDELNAYRGSELLAALLCRCDVPADSPVRRGIAIDAPLGWPAAMLNLINVGSATPVHR